MEEKQYIVHVPLLSSYSNIKHCLNAWDGESIRAVKEMIKDIHGQTGTPQNTVDWTEPDEWIDERLSGDSQRLAKKIWEQSDKKTNPRYTGHYHRMINKFELLSKSASVYKLEERGRSFIDDGQVMHEIDRHEGIPKILSLLADFSGEKNQPKRSDLLDDWRVYLLAVSNNSAMSVVKDSLLCRLKNLMNRGFVKKEGHRYSITDTGEKYLQGFSDSDEVIKPTDERNNVAKAVKAYNESQKEKLKTTLMQLEPFAFEHFVKELLEAMDYENVEVTKQTSDKGVDVTANYQFGITEITEVVQVKRTEHNISRKIIDELRGALPYHDNAIKGTIITLGGFARGVEEFAIFPGARPITLIDGDRLIDLIVKHRVGIKREAVDLIEIDDAFFRERGVDIDDEMAE